jgi:hypothetical protein
MISYLNLLRLATWRICQPLTAVPSSSSSVVSDLFVWRNTASFKTYFELTSIPSLFNRLSPSEHYVTILIFNSSGRKISKAELPIEPCSRHTLDLSRFLPKGSDSYGTFAVFHSHTPSPIRSFGSFVAERGYVGYSHNSSVLLSYVHGNLDAIARSADTSVQMLGGQSLRRRSYMLQHLLTPDYNYEIAIVNSSKSSQVIRCDVLSLNGRLVQTFKASLQSRAMHLIPVSPHDENLKVVLHSKLVMARPLVFRSHNSGLDVFHG